MTCTSALFCPGFRGSCRNPGLLAGNIEGAQTYLPDCADSGFMMDMAMMNVR